MQEKLLHLSWKINLVISKERYGVEVFITERMIKSLPCLMLFMSTMSSYTMRNLMCMYILLLDLMMIKLWQENIHIIEKTVIVS